MAEARPRKRTSVIVRRVALSAATVVIVATVSVTAVFLFRGGRLFVVETPSMGNTAPIGSLVATTPVRWSHLHVGDVITFHPPTAPSQTYTHRIVSITLRGIQTRGDINGSTDGWVLHPADLVGRAAVILPGVGWILLMMPWLLLGSSVMWWSARWVEDPEWRRAIRHTGVVAVAVLLVNHFRPLFRVTVLNFGSDAHGDWARVVSDGVLPAVVHASGGAHVTLGYGDVATIHVQPEGKHHIFTIAEHVALPWWVFLLIGLLSVTPGVWSYIESRSRQEATLS